MSAKIKRFFKKAEVVSCADHFTVELDHRVLKSPGRIDLELPDEKLAETLVMEWRSQGEFIEMATMPFMRFASFVFDTIIPQPIEARAEIVKYARSDLLCYQSDEPQSLVDRQKHLWNPVLSQYQRDEKINFLTTTSISYLTQSEEDLKRFAALIDDLEGFELAAVHLITTLSGSALLALAQQKKWLSANEVWTYSHVDEDHQQDQWGADEEAQLRQQKRYADFRAASLVFDPSTPDQ